MPVTFSLPFCLLLPDGDYNIKLSDGDRVVLRLKKIKPKTFDERIGFKGLSKRRLRNISRVRLWNPKGGSSIEIDAKDMHKMTGQRMILYFVRKDGTKVYPELQGDKRAIYINTEIPRDRFGRLRYTTVTFISKDVISEDMESEKKRALDATNKLIDNYRIFSGSYWIHRIVDDDIKVFEVDKGGKDITGLSQFQPDLSESKVNIVKKYLLSLLPLPPYLTLELEARRAYHEGSFHLAIVYSVASMEALVKDFLIKMKEDVSNSYIKKILHDITLHDLLELHLRPLLSYNEFPNSLMQKLVCANRERDDVMHNYELDVTEDAAKQVLDSLIESSKILIDKLATRYGD